MILISRKAIMYKNKILFKNKYRIDSIRLKYWDYSNPGYYFVTICTKNMENIFGEIFNGKMILNEYGYIVKHYLKQINKHFRFVRVDSFITMPNHIHMVLFVKPRRDVAMQRLYMGIRNENVMSKISPKSGTISTIIRSYKSICTKTINKKYNANFYWQTRFYDNIIRNETNLYNVRQYIKNNPHKWERSRNNKKRE